MKPARLFSRLCYLAITAITLLLAVAEISAQEAWLPHGPGGDGRQFNSAWFASATTGWVVGDDGLIYRTTNGGTSWSGQTSGTTSVLSAIWGSDANNVWAVGSSGAIQKWDGITWSAQGGSTGQQFFGIWGVNASNAWAVGGAGSIRKWNGSSWVAQASGTANALRSVWGSDANNVWAVGDGGVILKWDGSVWSTQTSGTTQALLSVWGSDASNIWAMGRSGTILKWNGSAWSTQTSGIALDILGAWGSDANNVWAVAAKGTILKWDGSAWNAQSSGTSLQLNGVGGSDANNVWAMGIAGTIVKWNGSAWNMQLSGITQLALFSVWGSDASNVWAVGNSGTIVKWNGSAWSAQTSGASVNLNGVWGSDASNIWAVGGSGTIVKWNGSAWGGQTSGTTNALRSVWGSDASNVWAVGDSGTIVKWNGSAWSAQTSGTGANLNGVWGSDANNVWAVGDSGTIVKWNGSAWSAQTSGTGVILFSVWGSDASNVWALGNGGKILKWNGSAWSASISNTATTRRFVWGTSATQVVSVGDSGLIQTNASFSTAPTVTSSTANLNGNAATLTITGTGFDTPPGNNTVVFNNGAAGTVTTATATQLTVTFTTQPTSFGGLTVIVTNGNGSSGAAVQVANVANIVATLTGGDLVITDVANGGDTLSLSESASHLVLTADATSVINSNAGTGSGTNTVSIPLASITGSITVNAAGGADSINIGAFATPLPSLTLNGEAGNDVVNFNAEVTAASGAATAETILVAGAVRSTSGGLTLTASAGVTVNGTADGGSGTLAINSDVDANGAGSLVVGASGALYGVAITVQAADVDIASTATVGNTSIDPVVTTFVDDTNGLNYPVGMEFDAAGNLFVVNNGNNTVSKVTPGGVVSTFASSATLLGAGMQSAEGLAINTAGELFISNGSNNTGSVARVTSAGVASSFATGIPANHGLTFDGAGNLYVVSGNTSPSTQIMSKISPLGVVSPFVPSSNLSYPTDVALGTSGDFYVSSWGAGVIHKVTAAGVVSSFASVGGRPWRLDFDSSGNLFYVEQNGNFVSKVTPAGVVSTYITSTAISGASGIVVDASGNLLIGRSNNTIVKVAPPNAVTTAITIRPSVAGQPISLGLAVPAALSLTDAELDRLSLSTSGILTTGGVNAGAITVSSAITRSGSTQMALVSGSDIVFNPASIHTGGGALTVTTGVGGSVKPLSAGTDVTASTLAFGLDTQLAIDFAGTTVDTQYSQLNVAGLIDLTGAVLKISGSYLPVGTDTFTIVSNDNTEAIIGTFAGLAEGEVIPNFLGSGISFKITYKGGSGNDVVLSKADNSAPETTITANPKSLSNSSGASFSFSGIDDGGGVVAAFEVQLDNGGFSASTSPKTYSGLMDGLHTFEVRAIDNSGNTDATPASYTWTVDTVKPTVSIVVTDTALVIGDTSLVTFTFSEAVTDFANEDLSIANGLLTPVSSLDGGITWTATFTPTAGITDSSNIISLNVAGVSDAAGNAGTGTTDSNNYAIDTQRPTVVITLADTTLVWQQGSLVTFTFSEVVTDFSKADLSIPNGSLTDVITIDGGITWTAIFTPNNDIVSVTNVIILDNTGVFDLSGNRGTGSTDSPNFTIDSTKPVVTLAKITDGAENAVPNAIFRVTQSVASATNTIIAYSVGGTASATGDFNSPSGSVTIAAGDTSADISISITADTMVEPDETIQLTLTGISSGHPDIALGSTVQASATILNDDSATLTLAAVSADKAEGTGGASTDFTFSVTLSHEVQGGFTVAYSTQDGTATSAGSDYTDNDSILTFTGTASEVQTITVAVTHDAISEPNEFFTLELGAIAATTLESSITKAGSPQTGTLRNDDSADYTVTTVAGVMTVTDVQGNADKLTISEPATGLIAFAAAGRTFSVDGVPAASAGSSGDLSRAGIRHFIVNAAEGSDSILLSAFTGTLPSLTLNGGKGDDLVALQGNVTFATGSVIDLDLQNDDASPGVDDVELGQASGAATIALEGSASFTVRANHGMNVHPGCALSTVDGDVLLELNQQAVATAGNFTAFAISGGSISSTGAGDIILRARSGPGAVGTGGAIITDKSVIASMGTGSINITATIPDGSSGMVTGLTLSDSRITSVAGEIDITGTAGSGTAAAGNLASVGIDILNNASIRGTGSATVALTGSSGQANAASQGIRLDSGITTQSGSITLIGTSNNSTAGSVANHGIALGGTGLQSVGGNIVLTGTAGIGSTLAADASQGVQLYAPVSAGTGNVVIRGTSDDRELNEAISIAPIGTSDVSGNNISLIADTMAIHPTQATLTATGKLTLSPSTAATLIDLGAADSTTTLGLMDAELDRLTGASLVIGDVSAGHVTLSAAIDLADNMNTQIITAGDIIFGTQGSFDTHGGTLLLQSGSSPQATRAQGINNEVTASKVSFGNGLAFRISGTSINAGYDQLSVAGVVDLSGRSLTLSGTHMPVAGESFILVNNDSNDAIIGTFSGIAEGGTVSFNGRTMTVSYVGGTGNDVELKATVLPNLVSFVASPYTLNRNTGLLEQLLRVTNKSSETLQGYRVTLTNMPSYYTFWNKTHPVLPYADVYQSIAPGATVDFYAHIYSGTRTLPGWVATYTVEGIGDVTLNPTSKSMPPTDGSYLMDVNTLGVWDVSESLPWATVSPTSGKGPGLVTVTLLPNTTLTARSGNIKVGNATHVLTQTGVLQPVLGALAPFDCMVSQSVSLTIPTSNRPTTAYLATGLPKGLTIDQATGLLHGRPTVPGAYNVSIRARNVAGYSNTINTVITVHALTQDFVGNYHGYVERSASVYVGGVPNLGSRFEMLISATGDVTGKLIEGSAVKPFTGILSTDYATPNAASLTVSIASNTLSLNLSTAGVRGTLISSASSATAEMVAWRNVWNSANLPAAFGALHHFVLQTKPVAGTPEGHSTGAFTVNAITGALTVKGKLADGSAFVTSTFIGQDGQVLIYQPLYANRGSIIGQVAVAANAAPVTDNTVTGSVSWMKPAVAKDLAYPLGFGPLAFIADGGTYVPPPPGQLVMGLKAVLPPLNNSMFGFTLGGLDLLGQQFSQNARVVNPSASGVSNLLVLPLFNASLTPNPNGNRVTATVDAQSGVFSGSFTVPGTTVATNRLGSFSGLIVPTRGGTQGYGYFLLPYVPTPPQTVNTAPKLSGAVSFTASF